MLKHIFVGLLGGVFGAALGVGALVRAADHYPRTVNASDTERERFVGIVTTLIPDTAWAVLVGSGLGCLAASVLADRKPKADQIISDWLDQQLASNALTPDERDAAIALKAQLLLAKSR